MAISSHGKAQAGIGNKKKNMMSSRETRRAQINKYRAKRLAASKTDEAIAKRRKLSKRHGYGPSAAPAQASGLGSMATPVAPLPVGSAFSRGQGVSSAGPGGLVDTMEYAKKNMLLSPGQVNSGNFTAADVSDIAARKKSMAKGSGLKDFLSKFNFGLSSKKRDKMGMPISDTPGPAPAPAAQFPGVASPYGGAPAPAAAPIAAPSLAPSPYDVKAMIESFGAGGMSREQMRDMIIQRYGNQAPNYFGMIDDFYMQR